MTNELVYLGIAAVVIAVLLFLLRRASDRSRKEAPQSVQERLGVGAEAPARRPRRSRPGRDAAEAGEAAPEEPGDKVAEEAAPRAPKTAVAAGEDRAAYKEGLAKTRGGFVARLGKLFGRKQIDADVLKELEEVLFTADIGPRAADRIFQ